MDIQYNNMVQITNCDGMLKKLHRKLWGRADKIKSPNCENNPVQA